MLDSVCRLVALSLALGCTVGATGKGEAPTGADGATEAEVEDDVASGPLDLAPGSTLGGSPLVTEDDLVAPSWDDLSDVPEFLQDGDDDTLATLTCGDGEWLSVVGGAWTCTAVLPPARIDPSGAVEGDVLVMTGGTAQWMALDELLPGTGCPGGMVQTGDTCVETAVRAAATWQDAVLDCASDAVHLCTHAELVPGCVAGTIDATSSGIEWVADRTDNRQAAMAFGQTYACDATTESIGNAREYRCCTAAR